MNLTLFGASGRTGQLILDQALAQGHQVVALARNPARLGAERPGLTVVAGDARDPAAVSQAIAGAEAVISVLGPTGNRPELAVSQAMDNILASMHTYGVRRLVLTVGAGVRDPRDKPNFVHGFFGTLVRLLSRHVYQDMLAVADKVRASDLDWTIVRVPVLVDGPRTGRVWVGYVSSEMRPRITRADAAGFLLNQLADATYLKQAPAISAA